MGMGGPIPGGPMPGMMPGGPMGMGGPMPGMMPGGPMGMGGPMPGMMPGSGMRGPIPGQMGAMGPMGPMPGGPMPGGPMPGGPMPGGPMPGTPFGTNPGFRQTTSTTSSFGVPPAVINTGPAATTVTTTAYSSFVTSCFGRPVQLVDEHGKFLCGGDRHPHAHHNPHHSFHQSSYWYIEKHDGFSDRVRLRNTNGKYLCHEGHTSYCTMHHHASHSHVSWHMMNFPGFRESFVTFRSHGGHFLGCDRHGHDVHCHNNGGPHGNQRFEVRFV